MRTRQRRWRSAPGRPTENNRLCDGYSRDAILYKPVPAAYYPGTDFRVVDPGRKSRTLKGDTSAGTTQRSTIGAIRFETASVMRTPAHPGRHGHRERRGPCHSGS